MKKILIFLLATLIAVSCITLVACDKKVTDVKIENAPSEVTRGESIDYSKINIVVTYDDNTTERLKLTDKSVDFDPVDTSTTGTKTLSVTFGGKSDQVTITVKEGSVDVDKVQVSECSNENSGYQSYLTAIQEQTNKETEFFDREVNYKVGTDNGYVFLPHVTVLNENDEEIVLDDVKTTFKLYVENNGSFAEVAQADIANYLTKVENNVYYFSLEAIGKTFKLEVTLSDEYELAFDDVTTTVSREFDVVEGYNVYDALGLSVLDNLSLNSWKALKDTQLAWDGKKLSEYRDVKQVILHNDITVTAEFLPDNYFWKENEPAKEGGSISYSSAYSNLPENYQPMLVGSLKEAYLGEEYEGPQDNQQRGLYTSNGIGLSGNFLRLSYETGLVYNADGSVDTTKLPSKGIYVVHDWNNKALQQNYPEPHTSFIAMTHANEGTDEEGIIGTRTIENVYFVGQTKKTENYEGQPAGIMMMTSDMSGVQVVNTISTDWFCNIDLDGVGVGTLAVDGCKFYNSFSQMVYSWGTVKIDIKNSEMKRAGGPIIIMQTLTGTTERPTVTTIDENSELESWVTGDEAWFHINMGDGATVAGQMLQVATAIDAVGGTHYMRTVNEMQQANLIALVIPDAGDVMDNQQAIPGTINVGEFSYAMRDSVFEALINVSDNATAGATLATTTIGALGQQAPASLTTLQQGFEALASATQMLKVAPVYQSGNAFAYFDGKRPQPLTDLHANVQQLYGGATQVATQLEANATLLESAGDAQTATALKALASQWTELAKKLLPIASLNVGDEAQWAQSWTESYLAFWVNPGGLVQEGQQPQYNVKHFMILLGEDNATVA